MESLRRELDGEEQTPTWGDACRALEIVEGAERSLHERQVIELPNEPQGDEASFKALMAVGGSAILGVTLIALVVFAIVEGFRLPFVDAPAAGVSPDTQPSDNLPLALRLWPVYPLAAFLLLQLLLFAAKKPRDQ